MSGTEGTPHVSTRIQQNMLEKGQKPPSLTRTDEPLRQSLLDGREVLSGPDHSGAQNYCCAHSTDREIKSHSVSPGTLGVGIPVDVIHVPYGRTLRLPSF